MYANIKDLFLFLKDKDKKIIYAFQIYIFISSFFELFSFASIIPFISIVSNDQLIFSNKYLFFIYSYFNFTNTFDFILFFGILTICSIIISNMILALSTYLTAYVAYNVGLGFSHKLYNYYINQNYLFHINNDNSYLIAKITTESLRLVNQVIMPLLVSNSKIFIIVLLVLPLLIYDFFTTSIVFAVISLTYFSFFYFLRKTLTKIGTALTKLNMNWFKEVRESLGAIKELILLSRIKYYSYTVGKINKQLATTNTKLNLLSFLPKYIVETLAMIFIIIFILLLFFIYKDFIYLVPYLSFIAVFSYKFIPNAQIIYFSFSRIKANIEAFVNLKEDLSNSTSKSNRYKSNLKFDYKDDIILENISFNLKNNEKKFEILKNINIKIYKNEINALVGYSGAGKTSIINILTGLIEPSEGNIMIDKNKYKNLCDESWHKKVGYVPQKLFLMNDSIINNVCIGIPKQNINIIKVKEVLKLANLEEFISNDNSGIYKQVGDGGIKLSGGQTHRVGIARALYTSPEIIIFDEPTSAFDAVTERKFYDLLDNLSKIMTVVIITHKVDYLKKAKNISFVSNGQIIMSGTYEKLINKEEFKKLSIFYQN